MINAKLLQFRSYYYFILLVVIGQFKYHLIITTLRSELDLTMCQVYVFFWLYNVDQNSRSLVWQHVDMTEWTYPFNEFALISEISYLLFDIACLILY